MTEIINMWIWIVFILLILNSILVPLSIIIRRWKMTFIFTSIQIFLAIILILLSGRMV